ncbi:MAG: tetratricopeptide repeat protein [Ignavibacteriaceae bacterium]
MATDKNITLAAEYFNKAVKSQVKGKIETAIENYRTSIEIFPTAETHVFLGVAYSLRGYFEEAISECKVAIDLKPDFGMPYNNIGSYLISLGKNDEAISWLEKALTFKDCILNHQAYFNLGKIYEKKWDLIKALRFYNRALDFYPDFDESQNAIIRISALMN